MGKLASLGVANAIFLLSQLIVLSFLTSLATIELVGQFGWLMAVIQPAFMLFTMGMRSNIASDTARAYSFGAFSGLLIISTFLFAIFVYATVTVFDRTLLPLAVPLIFQKCSEIHSMLTYGGFQRIDRQAFVARSLLIRAVVGALVFGLVLKLTASAVLAFWAQTIVWIATLVLLDLPKLNTFERVYKPVFEFSTLKQSFLASWMLGLGVFLVSLQSSVPRFLVEAKLGLVYLALLTPIAFIERAVIGLFQSVEQVFVSRLSNLWNDGKAGAYLSILRKIQLGVLFVSIIGITFAIFYGESFLRIVFGEDYSEANELLIYISVAIAIRLFANAVQIGLIARRLFRNFFFTQLVLTILAGPIFWFSVDTWGLNGVGIGLIALATIRLMLFTWYARSKQSPNK